MYRSKKRLAQEPKIRLFNVNILSTQMKIYKRFVRFCSHLIFSDVIQQWMFRKFKAMIPYLLVWFLLRFLFTIMVYWADSILLQKEEHIFFINNRSNSTFGNISCLYEHTTSFIGNNSMGYLFVYFCCVYSSFVLVFDILEFYEIMISHRELARTPKGHKNCVVYFVFYRVNQMILHLAVLLNFTVRLLRLHFEFDIDIIFDDIFYTMIAISIVWSYMEFIQLLPVVGHFTVALQRMLRDMYGFIVLWICLTVSFSEIFFKIANRNEIVCLPDFSNFGMSFYSTFRILVNMLDFRKIPVDNGILLLLHIIYVFISSILFINFLIAKISGSFNWVNKHKYLILTIQRMCMLLIIDNRMSHLCNNQYRKFQKRFFEVEGERMYIVTTHEGKRSLCF